MTGIAFIATGRDIADRYWESMQLVPLVDAGDGGKGSFVNSLGAVLSNALEKEARSAATEEREICCKAICGRCSDGDELIEKAYHHPLPGETSTTKIGNKPVMECLAFTIRI